MDSLRARRRLERVVRSGDVEAARDALGSWLSGYAVVYATLVFALRHMVFKREPEARVHVGDVLLEGLTCRR
jgi:hypothetical protein